MMEEKKFAQLSKETISLYAETVLDQGVLSESVANILAEDVSYRIRELTQYSSQHMKHAKRRKIVPQDFLKAMKWANLEPVYGHSSDTRKEFHMVEDGDLFFIDDAVIDIEDSAYNDDDEDDDDESNIYPPVEIVDTTVNCLWPVVEESTSSQVKKSPSSSKQSNIHQSYFQILTKALLSDSSQLKIAALKELSSNAKIRVIFPRLVDFIKKSVPIVRCDVSKSLSVLLICETLFKNSSVCFERGVISLIECLHQWLVEPVDSCTYDSHWIIRHHIATGLSAVLGHVRTHLNETVNRLRIEYQNILKDTTRPPSSRYGALLGLTIVGTKSVVKSVLNLLDETLNSTTSNADYHQFQHLLKIVCVNMFHSYTSDPDSFTKNSGGMDLKSYHLYVSECFGDSILPSTTQLAHHLCSMMNITRPNISDKESNIKDNNSIDIILSNNKLNNDTKSFEKIKRKSPGCLPMNTVPLILRRRRSGAASRSTRSSEMMSVSQMFTLPSTIQPIHINEEESKFASLSGRMKPYGKKLRCKMKKTYDKQVVRLYDIII